MKTIDYYGKTLYSPKHDLVFKYLFGQKSDETLRVFLNDVLNLNIQNIDDITIANNEVAIDYATQKRSRMDLKIKTNDTMINVEIECYDRDNFESRSIYYLSKLVSNEVSSGDIYKTMNRCISLWILDFKLDHCDHLYDYAPLTFVNSNKVFSNLAEVHVIQLPLFDWSQIEEERDKWVGLLCKNIFDFSTYLRYHY